MKKLFFVILFPTYVIHGAQQAPKQYVVRTDFIDNKTNTVLQHRTLTMVDDENDSNCTVEIAVNDSLELLDFVKGKRARQIIDLYHHLNPKNDQHFWNPKKFWKECKKVYRYPQQASFYKKLSYDSIGRLQQVSAEMDIDLVNIS